MSCQLSDTEAAKCFACSRKGRNFLSCSRCDKHFHQQCLIEGAFGTESNWVCPLHSCSICITDTSKRSSVNLSVIDYVERCGSQCLACFRRFCPSHLDQAKSVVLPHETYGKHFPGVNDIIICNDCTRDKANQNQANKRRKLENGEAECMLSSSYAEQSPRRDNNGETDSHSSGENSPRDYKIIFSNYSFATPMSTHKDMVPEPPRKNIKLKFKDCLEFTEEPIRPQADENLITLLREVMRTTKKNQKIVANEIGVSPTTMSSYMNSKSKPTGWNKMERKLKQWITSLEVEVPAPRESALPSDNPSVLSESKEEASTDESRSPSSMDTRASSWDYSPRQIEENKLKSDVSHCMSNYIDHVQYQQPTSIYKANPFNQYANESFVDLPSHAMEHGYYGHYPPLDQSSVSYTHPFTQPASEVDPHTQASFWPPLNLNLNFDHSQISY